MLQADRVADQLACRHLKLAHTLCVQDHPVRSGRRPAALRASDKPIYAKISHAVSARAV